MGAHAVLGASKAERWLACPPSARLEERVQDRESPYAAEGTFMHELAELELHRYLGMPDSQYQTTVTELHQSPFFTKDIEEAVQTYVDYAIERIAEARQRSEDAEVQVEMRVDFSRWVPGGFGTADLVTVSDGVLEIVDLKGGANVAVEAAENPQIRLYALGALAAFDFLYTIDTVRMNICQPRMDSITMEELTSQQLLEWADTVVRPIAALADAGRGEFKAGEHCRWCRVQHTCRARAQMNLEIAQYDFPEPPLLTKDEIGEVLGRVDELVRWVNGVKDYALQQVLSGETVPGWKAVAGRSTRKYTDEDQVAAILTNEGYPVEAIHKPQELLGITAMETLLGKRRFAEHLAGVIEKPPGKPTLVPETDRRKSIDAAADFDE